MKLEQIARLCGAETPGAEFNRIEPIGFSIDTRTISSGELFFAIRGVKTDGHHFLADAFARGACGAVVARGADLSVVKDKPLLVVEDTLLALQSLASGIIKEWGRTIVAITGSSGKTTTKELTAHLLSANFTVLKTTGNLNNFYGLPLSILQMASSGCSPEDFDCAVLEMGMSAPGEIRRMCQIAPPQIAVVTNVGAAHLEFFKSVEAIADAKAELVEGLKPGGLAVLNADDPLVYRMRSRHSGPNLTFAVEREADVRASEIDASGLTGTSFKLRTRQREVLVRLPLPGRHNIYNALAAAAVADHLGVELEVIAGLLAEAKPAKMRGQIITFSQGFTVIDDSYNSNPGALREMLGTLSRTSGYSRRIAVLGEMLELGAAAPDLHRSCGRYAAQTGVDLLLGVRGLAREILSGAGEAGLPQMAMQFFETAEEAALWLFDNLRQGDLVLIKGSRGVRMDLIVAKLKERFTEVPG